MSGKVFKILQRNRVFIALSAILFVGGYFRFVGLNIQSAWSDELASWYFSRPDSILQVFDRVRQDIHPPGYFILLHFTQKFLGDSESALRLPSAIAGWLSILAIYCLGRRLYSEREGLMAALFVAVLWAPIYYSQEARSYSLLLLFSILTTNFWWGLLQSLRVRRTIPVSEAILYVVCAIVCSYLHYFGLLLVALQGAALAGLAYRSFGKIVLLYLPVGLAYVPWLPGMFYQFTYSKQLGGWIPKPSPAATTDYLNFLFDRSETMVVLVWTLFAFLLLRSWDGFKERRKKGFELSAGLMLVGWFIIPFLVTYIISQSPVQLLTPKNLIISLPAAYLLLARAITRVFPGKTPETGTVFQSAIAVWLATIFITHLLYPMHYYTAPHKEQIRAAVATIAAQTQERPSTLLIYCDVDNRLDYYFQRNGLGEKSRVNVCEAGEFHKITYRIHKEDYKYVLYFKSHKQPGPGLMDLLSTNFEQVSVGKFHGPKLTLFQVEKNPPIDSARGPYGRSSP